MANLLQGSAGGHTARLCAAPAPTDRALCARAASIPGLSPPLARRLSTGEEGSKMPRPKLLRGFICKAGGAGGSGFPQAGKKGCIERLRWAEHGGRSSQSPSWPRSKPGQGVGAGADRQGGQRGSALSRAETSLQSSDKPSFGQVFLGTVNFGANLWVNLSFPYHCPTGILWCLIKGCACYGAGFFIAGISSMTFIFTKHLVSQLWVGLASGPKSHEVKGQASCIADIS